MFAIEEFLQNFMTTMHYTAIDFFCDHSCCICEHLQEFTLKFDHKQIPAYSN